MDLLKAVIDFAVNLIANPQPSNPLSIGMHVDLSSGFDAVAAREERVAKLRQILLEAVNNPGWRMLADGTTFCNKAAQFEAQAFGYFSFGANELADEMIMTMIGDTKFTEDTIERGLMHALEGGLAFIVIDEHPHGHFVAIAPEAKELSGTWGEEVPMVAHVGKGENGIVRLSKAYTLAEKPRLRCFLLALEGV